MPGHLNPKDPNAEFMTRPVLHRTTTASDAAPAPYPDSVTEIIHLGLSVTATRNRVILIPLRTVGTGRITYDLWVNFPTANAGVSDVWFLHRSAALQIDRALVEFNDLFAGHYKVVVTHEDGGATFETYLSQGN